MIPHEELVSSALGKDEVSSSNLDSSSRITPEIFGFRVFSFCFIIKKHRQPCSVEQVACVF